MQDVQDEPLFCERVAGLDIAKAGAEVTIRVPSETTAPAPAGNPQFRHHPRRAGVAGRLKRAVTWRHLGCISSLTATGIGMVHQ